MDNPTPTRMTSLRASLLALGIAGLVYVAVLGLVVRAAIQPTSRRLTENSTALLEEYRASSLRVAELDAVITDLWRHLGVARTQPVPRDTLEPVRLRLQGIAETSTTFSQLAAAAEHKSELRDILGAAVLHEDLLRSVVLGVVAALELGEAGTTERLLRRADSLDAPLAEALNQATTLALQGMTENEASLQRSVSLMNLIIWVWLLGGILSIPLLARFLRRRLHQPLARIDDAMNRIRSGDLSVSLTPALPDEFGRLVEHFNRMTSVLRQRAAEHEQRAEDRSAARMKLVLDSALDAVVVADSAGNIKEWSPQAEQVFGWKRSEVLDRSIAETIVPRHYRVAHAAGLQRFVETAESRMSNRRMELSAVRRDGTEFPIEITITPIRRGSQIEFSAFIRDITESKRARAALSESEARYRAAFEQVAVGMVELDLSGRYLRVNPAFSQMVGRAPDDILGKRFDELTHPDDRVGDESIFAGLIASESIVRREKRYVRPDETVATARLTAALVRDAHAKPLYVLTVVEDITAEKRLEEELRQAHKMEAVGNLAGGFAHDFNNLLTAIIGFAELLRRTNDAPEIVREDAAAIIAAAERGADLARNLLTLARTAPVPESAIDIHHVLKEVRDIIARTFDRRIAIHLDLAACQSVVTGDRSLLTNAVLNLALNARDAMPEGGRLTISTSERTLSAEDCGRLANLVAPGEFVAISVQDNGAGMAPDVQQRAFEPFFTTKPAGKGTGIGLSMVYGTVRSHSGAVEVQSTVGAGTTFTIFLPLRRLQGMARPPASLLLETGSGRVLLADDEGMVREVAHRMLEQLGYEVDVTSDGLEALERFSSDPSRYELVILDGNMPRMAGREAAARMRAIAAEIPILLATGYLDPQEYDRPESYGFSAVIAKPYTMSDLSKVIAEQLPRREPRSV
jgi:PAS domain S-box-containing protein